MSEAATRGYLFVMLCVATEQGFDAYLDPTHNFVMLGGNASAGSWDEFVQHGGRRIQRIGA